MLLFKKFKYNIWFKVVSEYIIGVGLKDNIKLDVCFV